MKKTILLAFAVLLTGCEASTSEETTNYKMPRGMEDCKIYSMSGRSRRHGQHTPAVKTAQPLT